MPISLRPDWRTAQETPSIRLRDHDPHTRKSNQAFELRLVANAGRIAENSL